ncbi:hypothetical protein SH2C18_48630 [Clostridium sediminicola]|uniref:MurR/RpiR family transcriptional regulator n=1 Tax=Clostridium sediminicola TaxID=3114879 RepID=UPI0031F1D3CE
MKSSIIDEILKIKDDLPKKQKQLCNYIVLNYIQAGIMTVAQLAENSGVGTTTVMRLIKTLNYDNYAQFKRDLLNLSLLKNTSSYSGIKKRSSIDSNDNYLNELATRLKDYTDSFITKKNTENLNKAVQMMIDAKQINILGLRSSQIPATYLEHTINRFYPYVRQLSYDSQYIFDKAFSVTKDEVLVVFSVWPCTKLTINIADACHKNGIPIILITNTSLNPIARYADVFIDTNSVNSECGILPSMFVAEAIISDIWQKTKPQSTNTLEKLEQFLDQQNLFIWENQD